MPNLTGRFAARIGLGSGDVGILAVVVVGVSARLFIMGNGLLLLLSGVLNRFRLLLSCAGGRLFVIVALVGHFEGSFAL